jgi:hypothetical protein
MVLSTAMPTLMAAMVMVIMSSGMSSQPRTLMTHGGRQKIGEERDQSQAQGSEQHQNIRNSARATTPMVLIWESKRLCSILL